jgi:hypothetical protein
VKRLIFITALLASTNALADASRLTAQCTNNKGGMLFDFAKQGNAVGSWSCTWEEGNSEITGQHLFCNGTSYTLQSHRNRQRHTIDLYDGKTIVTQFKHGDIIGPRGEYMECIWLEEHGVPETLLRWESPFHPIFNKNPLEAEGPEDQVKATVPTPLARPTNLDAAKKLRWPSEAPINLDLPKVTPR